MSQLQLNITNLQDILDAVSNLPFGVDTSDATAAAENLEAGYTAYVNGEKIEGNLEYIDTLQTFTGTEITDAGASEREMQPAKLWLNKYLSGVDENGNPVYEPHTVLQIYSNKKGLLKDASTQISGEDENISIVILDDDIFISGDNSYNFTDIEFVTLSGGNGLNLIASFIAEDNQKLFTLAISGEEDKRGVTIPLTDIIDAYPINVESNSIITKCDISIPVSGTAAGELQIKDGSETWLICNANNFSQGQLYRKIKDEDDNILTDNGILVQLSDLSIFGDASPADVRQGKKFTSKDGTIITGTWQPKCSFPFSGTISVSGGAIIVSGQASKITIPLSMDLDGISSCTLTGTNYIYVASEGGSQNSYTENIKIPYQANTAGGTSTVVIDNFIIANGNRYSVPPSSIAVSSIENISMAVITIPAISDFPEEGENLNGWQYQFTGYKYAD